MGNYLECYVRDYVQDESNELLSLLRLRLKSLKKITKYSKYYFHWKYFRSSTDYACGNICFTSFSKYFLNRSNRASDMMELALMVIALGSSSVTFLLEAFLRSDSNLLCCTKYSSTARFSLSNLLRLLHFPVYRFCRIEVYHVMNVK